MVVFRQKSVNIIITGYTRELGNTYILMDILQLICDFYDEIISFNVCDNFGLNIINHARGIYCNERRYYFMKDNRLLQNKFIKYNRNIGSNVDLKLQDILTNIDYFNDKNVRIVSEGLANKVRFLVTSNGLYRYDSNLYDGSPLDGYQRMNWDNIKLDSKLIKIQCGSEHVLFLCENGTVWGSGNNKYRQLSFENDGHYQIQYICRNITDIICAVDSSYIKNSNSIWYGFGSNYSGELGINDPYTQYSGVFKPVLNGARIDKISAGVYFIGILTVNNVVIMFGSNECYQCGTTDERECHSGNVLKSKIIDVNCGGYHSIIKRDKNDYYSFGDNTHKRALINDKIREIKEPTLISKEYIYTLTKSRNIILALIPTVDQTLILQYKNGK